MNFGYHFKRALARFHAGRPAAASRLCTTVVGAGAVSPFIGIGQSAAVRLGSVLLLGGATATAWKGNSDSLDTQASEVAWVNELASRQSVQEVLSPGNMLRKHPLAKMLVEQDHLVSRGASDTLAVTSPHPALL